MRRELRAAFGLHRSCSYNTFASRNFNDRLSSQHLLRRRISLSKWFRIGSPGHACRMVHLHLEQQPASVLALPSVFMIRVAAKLTVIVGESPIEGDRGDWENDGKLHEPCVTCQAKLYRPSGVRGGCCASRKSRKKLN